MSIRVTQLGAETVEVVANNARVTELGAEVVMVVTNNARATEIGAEYVYAVTSNNARLTQVGAEAVYQVTNDARASQIGAEYVYRRAASCTAVIVKPATTADVAAVADGQFIVAASDPDLPNARVATDSTTIAFDNSTPGETKAGVIDGSLGVAKLSATGTPSATTFLRGDNTWAAGGGGASVLDDLTDVTITSVADGDVLTYDAGTSAWVNQAPATGGGPGSHAYWRVAGSESGLVANYVAYSAMAFKDTGGSSIATTGGTAIESAHFSSFAVANLFDGTDATFWESNNNVLPWAGYQFASAVAVGQVGLQKAASMDGSNPALVALVQYSDDGSSWRTAATIVPAQEMSANDTMYWFVVA